MLRYNNSKQRILKQLGLLYFCGFTTKIGHTTSHKILPDKIFILKEQQKIRFCYGMTKKQLVMYFLQLRHIYNTFIGFNLLQLMEQRLDSNLIRINIVMSIKEAKQLIVNKNVFVNKICIMHSTFICNKGDVIHLKTSINLQLLLWRNILFNQRHVLKSSFISFIYKNSFKYFRFVLIKDFRFYSSRLKINVLKIPTLFIK